MHDIHYLAVSYIKKKGNEYAAVQVAQKFVDLDLTASQYVMDIIDRAGEGTLFAFRDSRLTEEICELAVAAYMEELEAESK